MPSRNPIRRELGRFFDFLRRRLYFGRWTNRNITDRFHKLYYDSGVPFKTKWFGTTIVKCPFDLWVYQEIIHEHRPDVIVETGTFQGGSALYLAHLFDLAGHGRVITVDVQHREGRPQHPRISYVTGSSTDPAIVERVKTLVGDAKNVLVILDSDHSQPHVEKELEAYAPFVPKGGYLIVEDTNVNGHPAYRDYGPGPWEAVGTFLAKRKDFEVDRAREKFFLTMNPRGFLRRIA